MHIVGAFLLIGIGIRWYANGLDVLGTRFDPEQMPVLRPGWFFVLEVMIVLTWPVWVAWAMGTGVMQDGHNLGRWIRGESSHDA